MGNCRAADFLSAAAAGSRNAPFMVYLRPYMKREPSHPAETPDLHAVLDSVFGFTAFRPHQEEIVRRILSGTDVLAVMPTGGGKSLCYQLPAAVLQRPVVVVSPLISLMKDQVDGARENGLSAAYLNSSLSVDEAAEVNRAIASGTLDLLYIAPERFAAAGFLERLSAGGVSLFAVDEAHCISQWGHDFRPDYRNLSVIRERFPGVPIAAFTASATLRVQNDIASCLGLEEPYMVRASFDRPNLFYEVRRREKASKQVLELIRTMRGASGIVYCPTRAEVDRYVELLRTNGVRAGAYHAGLPGEERHANQEAFDLGTVEVMVATVAFGMGIDKPDIRFVVHTGLPKDMESYYQETGRAGRDGEPARCLLLYSMADVPLQRRFIEELPDETLRATASKKKEEMIRLAGSRACRRKSILRYFGEQYGEYRCGACDVCTGSGETIDITEDCRKLLSAVYRTGQRFGAGHVIDVVTGADTERIRQYRHNELKTFGVGKGAAKAYWRAVTDELLAQGFLRKEGDRYPLLVITKDGLEVLYGRKTVEASSEIRERKTAVEKKAVPAMRIAELSDADEALFLSLRSLRAELAAARRVPPYVIASDRTLREVAVLKPTDTAVLRQVHGIGEKKLKELGPKLLDAVRRFLEDRA